MGKKAAKLLVLLAYLARHCIYCAFDVFILISYHVFAHSFVH